MAPKAAPKVEPPPSTPPATVTKADLDAISGALTNLTTKLGELGGRVDILAQERVLRNEPAVPPTEPKGFQRTVTLDQINAALDEGDYKKANALQLTYSTETTQEIMQGLQKQIGTLEQQGATMISNVVRESSVGKLPYYERFKKEIDAFLEKVPVGARTHPDMYKYAHDAIVGQNIAAIVAEESEKAVRKIMDGGGGYKPGDGGGNAPAGGEGVLTIDSVYGDDAKDIKRMLQSGKITMDVYAQRRGFPDEQTYLKHVKEFREKEAKEAV